MELLTSKLQRERGRSVMKQSSRTHRSGTAAIGTALVFSILWAIAPAAGRAGAATPPTQDMCSVSTPPCSESARAAVAAIDTYEKHQGHAPESAYEFCLVVQNWAKCGFPYRGFGHGSDKGVYLILHLAGAWNILGSKKWPGNFSAAELHEKYDVPPSIAEQLTSS